MKKIVGLFMVLLISSVSVFAQGRQHNKHDRKQMDPTKRWEKMAEDLKLDDKQIAEFKKINEDFHQKMVKERETMKAQRETNKAADKEALKADREKKRETMLAMRNDKNEQVKKILTDEQYKSYLEKQKGPRDSGRNNKGHKNGKRK